MIAPSKDYWVVDAHGHLSDERLLESVDKLIPDLQKLGLRHMILGGIEPREWQRQREISTRIPGFITRVAGIHPWTVRDHSSDELEVMMNELEKIAPYVTAIGEMGVDFATQADAIAQRMKQPLWCERQLDLATRLSKPVVLHVVKGHDVMLGLLRNYRGVPGLVHGWQGSEQDGRKYIDRGFVLSIGPRSLKNRKPSDLAWIPSENFVLESDGPDLPGAKANMPSAREWMGALRDVASFLSKALKLPMDQIWAMNRDNLERIMGISISDSQTSSI